MQISADSGSGSTARIALTGKLDINGAETIAIPLAALSGAKQYVVIDMSGVSFLASIGIRHLVSATKTLMRRGGRLVLLAPQPPVLDVLTTSGITDLIAVAATESDVQSLLGGATA